ncbi:transglutaminase family protein [Gryllotalpicola ginsengisoli]|uniref:transglutaminase family protein n=1 Tax=Gryllotalpicola ginsengisoli TaxID=444608 RepID=UPI0003B35F86|nr:DUF3488 and transglutaminase-like domain-containing protein [Gryllotalpicola ginsengisoli]
MFDRRRSAVTRVARGAWPLAGALLLLVAATSVSIIGLIQGAGWWWALLSTAALMLAVPAALRSAGVPRWAASVIDLAVLVALVDLLYGGGHALLGVIPTPKSVQHVALLAQQAQAAVVHQGVPAQPLPELIFLVVVFGGVFALLLDVVAVWLRLPALTALAVLAVLVVPAVLQTDGLSFWALTACAVAYFAVLRADGRLRFGSRGGGAVALSIGAASIVVALVVATTAPGFDRVGRATDAVGPVSLGSSVNPLVDLAQDLRRPVTVPVLQYTTDAKLPTYLQLTTLDSFNGTIWRHSSQQQQPLVGGTRVNSDPPGLDGDADVPADSFTTEVQVQNLVSYWLPAPYPAQRVSGGSGLSWSSEDLTLTSRSPNLRGEEYSVTSLDVEPTTKQLAATSMAAAGKLPFDVQRDLYLPDQVPDIITRTARQVAQSADGSSEFALALALQDYFQSAVNGFTYSTDTPDSQDGSSLDVVAAFLTQKEGYCVHFASAMAVLARVLGIPSRIAIGYLPGSAVSVDGDKTTYAVDSSDLHAWPQLYFPGIGWLAFEPTVTRGSLPAYTIPTADPTSPSSEPSEAAAAPSASSSAQATLPADQSEQQTTTAVAAQNPGPALLGGLIAVALLLTPFGARRGLRGSRLRRLREQGGPPALAWAELRDTARDLGYAVSATETPRAFAARLAAEWHPGAGERADLDALLELVEEGEYGPPQPWARHYELAELTDRVAVALERSRGRGIRARALFAPVSLLAPLLARRGDAHAAG